MSETRFSQAIARFDAIHAEDPTTEPTGGGARPRALVEAERLTAWVEQLAPEASEPLRLAARCQHLGRFRVPRGSYPEGRVGYLKWRKDLGRLHAETAADILREVGYDPHTIERVRRIVQKQGLTTDPDVQTMEDALCLSFLEHEYPVFCTKHDDAKVVTILQKTWQKMSEQGQRRALAIPLSGRALELVRHALGAS